ncbi:MAG: leucine--tRNA ligase [Wolbachia endosymbiont of Menacanthus eurysternus]|nr:MAG: leucine--tRNA ligase [Wolbachia endosymbiont of Menacanthus eurysternus]
MKYDFKKVEKFYQDKWNFSIKKDNKQKKCYVLEMFPYPSGKIHMGHLRNYVIGDVIARYKRGCGFEVLHPIGWDAFGLPAENAARDNNIDPETWTKKNINSMRTQLKSVGLSYNWERELSTCEPYYYKHEQKFFLDFLKFGLVYRKESWVNWDPVDKTVLANEQIINGKGWRSGALIEKRKLFQWFLKITDFAEDLLKCLQSLKDWPEKVRVMQERWIGKSEGVVIEFEIVGINKKLKVFTTSPHTLFGASFLAIAVEHPIIHDIMTLDTFKVLSSKYWDIYVQEKNKLISPYYGGDDIRIKRRIINDNEKYGIYTGLNAKHPFLDKELPLYIVNFVLMEHGGGAIFGCPAHNKCDFEFAQKYNLPIIPVISSVNSVNIETLYPVIIKEKESTTTNSEVMINSEFLNGLTINIAKEVIIKKLEEKRIGKKTISYRLHDWGISRQRYWGCPIPIIYCKACGTVPVPEKDLPIILPIDVDFKKSGNPLDKHPTWKFVDCPKCGRPGERETDTFDTFFESSWYFAAFCSENKSINKNACNHFMPVNYYIGGIEHAVLHLLYSRFFCRALKKCGYLDIEEPFSTLITQGVVCHVTYKDKNGKWLFPEEAKELMIKGIKVQIGKVEKMSKSKKNIIDPNIIIEKYGADTARLFVLSDTPPEKDMEWSDDGIESCFRYINKLWRMVIQLKPINIKFNNENITGQLLEYRKKIHKLLYELTNDLENCKLNCVIAKFRKMTNLIAEIDVKNGRSLIDEGICILIRVIEPFIPHLAGNLWREIGGNSSTTLCLKPWPQAIKSLLIDDMLTIAIQINGKFRKTIRVAANNLDKEELKKMAINSVSNRINRNKIRSVYLIQNKIVNIIV